LRFASVNDSFDLLRALTSYIERIASGQYSLWRVGVELILIGSVVYAALRFLQGTRGARLVKAVSLILIVSFLVVRLFANTLRLERINFLYPYFVMAVFLVTLVAFQPELRRGLMRIGEGSLLRGWHKETARLIDPLVRAAASLSKKKIGALIAIQRGTEVGALIGSGVKLDAVVTAELVESIFWPGCPLHDLGVIVAHGRIAAAGCQFPLIESDDVDRSMGSRHRAALGMSLESDALVIVVSEETGAISLADRGKLRRSLTPDGLRDALAESLGLEARPDAAHGQPPVLRSVAPPAEPEEVAA
jgi:diadenylate cyclase